MKECLFCHPMSYEQKIVFENESCYFLKVIYIFVM